MNKPIYNTREEWLEHAVELFTPMFKAAGYEVPKVRTSCGWPSARGTSAKNRCIGQCWSGEASADGINQIFISPYLDDVSGPQGVLATLIHEVCHAVVGLQFKHGKIFRKCAESVGLEGKMTATAAGDRLRGEFGGFSKLLGEYPHSKLDLKKSPVKKQTTRMIKMECPECGYVARTSQKWIDEVGVAHCPSHGAMTVQQPEPKEDEGDE